MITKGQHSMTRRVPWVWLVPTLFLGLDLGWRLADHHSPSLAAQIPPQHNSVKDIKVAVTNPRGTESEIHKDLQTAYEQFAPVNEIFQKVAKVMSPSVVHINARKTLPNMAQGGEVEESGSGVVVATNYPGQYILTNNHVVQDAPPRSIRIQLADGRVISPERVWADLKADIAILKISDSAPRLVPARMGDSDEISVGTWVLALGSPFGLMHSVSQGIISARGRHEAELFQDGVENQDFLQTDAAINPGNSGGPLVNLKGEIIGINTAIASQGGGSEGVGFSIPINLARWIMDQLLSNGRVNRGAMGIDLDELLAHKAEELGLDRPRGAIVTAVHPESPALLAGLKGQDVILRFNQNDVTDLNHLINLVSMAPIGKPAEVVIWRDRKRISLQVTVGARDRVLAQMPQIPSNDRPSSPIRRPRPETRPGKSIQGSWGLLVTDLEPGQSARMGLTEGTQGAVVIEVETSSPLAKELASGDVITAINGRRFTTAKAVMDALKLATDEVPGGKAGKPLEIEVMRTKPGEASQTFVLKVDS
ncbi:MAG: PDZ domain-containing protein [Planctomycetota bacterium]|nr:MAG: PDZ domain-containing protein [Planctomycetota bacterium]